VVRPDCDEHARTASAGIQGTRAGDVPEAWNDEVGGPLVAGARSTERSRLTCSPQPPTINDKGQSAERGPQLLDAARAACALSWQGAPLLGRNRKGDEADEVCGFPTSGDLGLLRPDWMALAAIRRFTRRRPVGSCSDGSSGPAKRPSPCSGTASEVV